MPKTTGVDGDRNGHSRPPLMDIEAVAHRLSVGVRHVRRLVTEKRIPYRKWGHLLRFEPEEIEEWIEATRVPPSPASPLRLGRPGHGLVMPERTLRAVADNSGAPDENSGAEATGMGHPVEEQLSLDSPARDAG